MNAQSKSGVRKGRFVVGSLAVITGFVLLLCIIVGAANAPVIAADNSQQIAQSQSTYQYDNPNAVSAGLGGMAYETGRKLDAAGSAADTIVTSFGTVFMRGASVIFGGFRDSTVWVVRGVVGGAVAVGRMPGAVAGSVTQAAVVSSVTKPADTTPVPVIEPLTAEQAASRTMVPAAAKGSADSTRKAQTAVATVTAVWPIHGTITTLFGVPEPPYQAVHTGMDISDGRPSGTTPVVTFKPGTVTAAVYGGGLGNHVVVDHGGGITSVYGHLASIAVKTGQSVDSSTILGYEGTTGVSTGTHLHFEIRVDGQPVNPQRYIAGQP